eukprot:scaffold76438_cov60-Attheya_sp.AAC.4
MANGKKWAARLLQTLAGVWPPTPVTVGPSLVHFFYAPSSTLRRSVGAEDGSEIYVQRQLNKSPPHPEKY